MELAFKIQELNTCLELELYNILKIGGVFVIFHISESKLYITVVEHTIPQVIESQEVHLQYKKRKIKFKFSSKNKFQPLIIFNPLPNDDYTS